MSHEDLVRRWLTAFAEDADAFREALHPDIEWFPFEENHTPSRGIDAGMRIRNQWVGAWEEMQAELEDLVEKGESVVATVHVVGIGKASGVQVDTRLYLHFKVRDDKIVYLYEYEERQPALEAVGLEPS
jgi:ketosteroid isomerase-like protein